MLKRLSALLLLLTALPTWGAIAVDGSTTAQCTACTADTVDVPANTDDGDLVVIFAWSPEETFEPFTSPGFTEFYSEQSSGVDHGTTVLYKVASSESGSYTVTSAVDPTTNQIGLAAVTFSGVDTADPFDVAWNASIHLDEFVNDQTPDPASITTESNGAMVVHSIFPRDTAISDITPSTGYAIAAEEYTSNNRKQVVQTKIVAVAGVEDPDDVTSTGGGATDDFVITVIALKALATNSIPPIAQQYIQEHSRP